MKKLILHSSTLHNFVMYLIVHTSIYEQFCAYFRVKRYSSLNKLALLVSSDNTHSAPLFWCAAS